MKMKTEVKPQTELPKLTISRKVAVEKIENRIAEGKQLKSINIIDESSLEKARGRRSRWSQYNKEMLLRMFSDSSIAEEYDRFVGVGFYPMDPSFDWLVNNFEEDVDDSINRLESIKDRLDLIPEQDEDNLSNIRKKPSKNKVFVVHGHDELEKETVARFLINLGLTPVILHEQPNMGKTIIEKLEIYSDVSFAVVLLTPDDRAMPKDEPERQELRARQNVIFELGFFFGKLGRNKVAVLYKKGVSVPSDYSGIVYIEMDINNGWQLPLAREIKKAGLDVDLNKL